MTSDLAMPLQRPARLASALIALCLLIAGCATEPPLVKPAAIDSPYPAEVVIAVAPLTNESGAAIADELAVTDALVNHLQATDGVSAIPTNRTIGALRALDLPGVRSPREAIAVARALGADAIIVGSITAWDPYAPPKLGLSLVLFARTTTVSTNAAGPIDPAELALAATDAGVAIDDYAEAPVASVANTYDAANHDTIAASRAYAIGRTDPSSALGDRLYTQSMTRFTEFACFHALQRLLDQEARRVELAGADSTPPR